MDMLWECPLCKVRNTVGSKRCTLCRRPYVGSEKTFRRKERPSTPELEEDEKVFDDFNVRIERASAAIEKESTPPRGAIRLVIPNNPVGWLTVLIVVLALAMTLAVVKTMF